MMRRVLLLLLLAVLLLCASAPVYGCGVPPERIEAAAEEAAALRREIAAQKETIARLSDLLKRGTAEVEYTVRQLDIAQRELRDLRALLRRLTSR